MLYISPCWYYCVLLSLNVQNIHTFSDSDLSLTQPLQVRSRACAEVQISLAYISWDNNNNNNNSRDDVYGAVIMTKVVARDHPVHLMNADWAPGGRQPSDQASRLGLCESAENWQLSSTSTVAIVIITQPVGWYSFYRPSKGGKLSRPKHCSKGAQPVLKTVYRSSFRDKHNCQRRDSNLDPLTPQSDALTTRLLRPACPSCRMPALRPIIANVTRTTQSLDWRSILHTKLVATATSLERSKK